MNISTHLANLRKRKFQWLNTRLLVLIILFYFSFGISGYALLLPYLGFTGPIHTRLFELPALFFYLHTIGGAAALILAPFQLLKQKTNSRHKIRGYAYVGSVVLSSIGGFYMAQEAYGGLSSTIALTMLAITWLVTTYLGVFKALTHQFNAHREWMIRSIALTFSAITLRLISPGIYQFFNLYEAQQIIYWSCWPINLLIAEYYIRFHLSKAYR